MIQADLFGATLAEARESLKASLSDGANCPCCGQYAKIYRRKMNSGMAYALILLYRETEATGAEWIHLRSLLLRHRFHTGDYAYFLHWGLIEEKPHVADETDGRAGLYRITKLGKRFVRGEDLVARHVYVYDAKSHGFGDERTDIRSALGDRFSYDELMRGDS